jgi:choline dehydrogenase
MIPSAKAVFDVVIVGAGSAGCVLANRLSADPGCRVLLCEAGPPDRSRAIHAPIGFTRLFRSRYDWNFRTEPEPHIGGRRLYIPRGRTLGGSSSINAMIYIRGRDDDYDRWRDGGCEGWGFADVLPAFLRAEDQARGPSPRHGTGGPLRVEDPRSPNPLSHAFVAAARTLGLPYNDDFNSGVQDGVGLYQLTQRRGLRCSTAVAYLAPVRRRANLTVWTDAHVERVRFAGTRAVGIDVVRGEERMRVDAEREVILCAGAIGSPALLLRSGIGAADKLRALGIAVVADLASVGESLQDHPVVPLVHACTRPVSLLRGESRVSIAALLLFRRGPLTSNVAEAGGFWRSGVGLREPDIQFHFVPAYFVDHGLANPPGHGFSLGPTLLSPTSRGRVELASEDPREPPRILGHVLRDAAEVAALRSGLRIAREIVAAAPFADFRGAEVLPGSAVHTDADLDAYIRANVELLYHPVGTCRMGTGPDSVVDPQLRVRGVERLRVVDASVMPEIVGGNTNAPTIMIAEKAARMI